MQTMNHELKMNSEYWQEELETMPREALRELQAERLRKTVRSAISFL